MSLECKQLFRIVFRVIQFKNTGRQNNMSEIKRIGFYVRNRFQVTHFRPLFDATPNAVWIARNPKRLKSFGVRDGEKTATSQFRFRALMEKRFDVIVTQGGLPKNKRLKTTALVMMQYGYAKEPYNFGAWREKADLILAYGPYAQRKFSDRAPSIAIGNPRWDDWNSPMFRESAGGLKALLNPNKKTVLYAPTWGDLSSLPNWLDTVQGLSDTYNVLIKGHHNSTRDGQISELVNGNNLHFLPNEDLFRLMAVTDVMISDLSGAIFDAVLCKLPVVLILPDGIEDKLGKKLDRDSLELSHRAEFGIVVEAKDELQTALQNAIRGQNVDDDWYNDLFLTDGIVAEKFLEAIKTL